MVTFRRRRQDTSWGLLKVACIQLRAFPDILELKRSTLLRRRRKAEGSFWNARSVVSQIFKLIVSASEKRLGNVNVVV